MTTKVVFVELTAFEGILPLATGYLQAYASQDPEIARECSFSIYSRPVDVEQEPVIADVVAEDADVYALSCYVWNMAFVRRLLKRLLATRPEASIIMGGPQIMNHLDDYVDPQYENVVACNGEGERTFAEFLRQEISSAPDRRAVPGVSFWEDGELVTTERAARINDLMEIPSPFTTGVFESGKYTTAILETNRGCPFHCGFCAWGNATNDKVHKFEDERVRNDIEWICKNKFVAIFIADANWGIGPRDVEFTEHLVGCSKKYGYPFMVAMAAAKNKPDRMATITEKLVQGGLLTSQPISLQTMSSSTLELVARKNIRPETFSALQQTLRDKRISSYIELIWPLPGETIDSSRQGVGELCRSRADTIITYPQLLLHNTPIYDQRELLGLSTRSVPSEVAEAEVVTSTNWVDRPAYEEGAWFSYVMHALYNVRGLYYLGSYLDRADIEPFAEFFASAVRYFRSRTDSPITQYLAESVATLRNYDFHDSGMVAHIVLHSHRAEFDELITDFVRSRPWADDPEAEAAFELDLLARPYIYLEAPHRPDRTFRRLTCTDDGKYGYRIGMPSETGALVAALDMPDHEGPAPTEVSLTHRPERKMPYMPSRTIAHNASYCQGMILRLREYLPKIVATRQFTTTP